MQQNVAVQERPVEDGPQQVSFSATGSEYFRIWIVNVLLTIVTLGVYSAWAKVRSNQYFYSSTRLAGSSFEYHGNPMAILKGRIVAVLLVGAYHYAGTVSLMMALPAALLLAALMPLLTWKSLQFKLHNTSFRGIRFGFDGSVGKAYKYFLLVPLLFLTLIFAPLAHQRIKRFQHASTRFGAAHFRCDPPVRSFYVIYGCMFAAYVGLIIGAGVLGALLGGMFGAGAMTGLVVAALVYVLMLAIAPLFLTQLQNVIWNHTGLREHDFRSDMQWGPLAWIYFTNLLGIIVTLGLFTPFAKVRAMKYRLESVTLVVDGSLDDFVASEQEHVGSIGEGVSDFMDFDLSL